MDIFEESLGSWSGPGAWRDAAGKKGRYRVSQICTRSDNGVDVTFRHNFDDSTVVEARYRFVPLNESIFDVRWGEVRLGAGYVLENYTHYFIKAKEAFVEVSWLKVDGRLRIYGSSSKNADGLFIAWNEELERKNETA